ncbi:MAG: tyrosine-type recombinase/integrase [Gemmatimonadetes bacterium]|nr:tyrosine-type recombinase/integrase [Gemmatimonadota bacterium]
MATLYRRGRIWWVKVYRNGNACYESLKTADKSTAKYRCAEIEKRLYEGTYEPRRRIPLDGLVEEYRDYLRTRKAKRTAANEIRYLDQFLRANPVRRLDQVTSALVSAFITRRVRHDGISPRTANLIREVVYRLFEYAIKHHAYVSSDPRYLNPIATVEKFKLPASNIRSLNPEQIEEQFRVVQPNGLAPLVATYIYAGLRREEALWLQPSDVDLGRRLVHVRAKTVNAESWQPKTKRNRIVPISRVLHGYLAFNQPRENSLWYFPSPKGKRWSPTNLSRSLRRINKRAGLDWGCLDYRHTFGTQLAMKGISLHKIAKFMGNSPEICRRHYAAVHTEDLHDDVEFGMKRTEDEGSDRNKTRETN